MAIRPVVVYPGQTSPVSPEYPHGGAKNETAPGNFDGTPFELQMLNDIFGFEQALLKAAGITPSANPDTALDKNSSQYLQAVLNLVMTGFTFDDSGAVDAYVLSVVGNNPAPAAYTDNMTIAFIPGNTNTGASTVNVEGLGVKDLVGAGAPLIAGDITANHLESMYFDLANDRFELHIHGANLGQASAVDLTLTGGATSPPDSNTIVKENITKAWINFDGTGTIAIRNSYNIASIVDNGTGDYSLNVDTDFANIDIALAGMCREAGGAVAPVISLPLGGILTVGTVQIEVRNIGGSLSNVDLISVILKGDQ